MLVHLVKVTEANPDDLRSIFMTCMVQEQNHLLSLFPDCHTHAMKHMCPHAHKLNTYNNLKIVFELSGLMFVRYLEQGGEMLFSLWPNVQPILLNGHESLKGRSVLWHINLLLIPNNI